MTLKLNGTNSVAAPAYAGDDADTGLQCGTDELKLVTGGTARATVDSSGNLGVGTTSPTEKLTVTGGNIQVDASDRKIGFKLSGNSNAGYLIPYTSGGNTELVNERSGSSLIFKTANTERMRVLSGGGLAFNGDTSQDNALDDYEEGTWTPSVYSDNLTFDSATYVKVGRMVTVHCHLTGVTSYNASTGNPLYVFGFPFTTASGGTNNTATSATGSCKLSSMNSSITTGTLSVCMDKGNTRCRIQKNATNASDDFIRLSEVGTGSFGIVINVTYYTT